MSRVIESNLIRAVHGKATNWKKANTSISVTIDGVTRVYLHGNLIAEFSDDTIAVSLAGWDTRTTRSRLRCLLAELGGFGSSCWSDRGRTFVSWRSDIRPLEGDDFVVFDR